MATGFSVMDALNKYSKEGVAEKPKARFRTKDISIFKMYRNEMNFYSIDDVEELAGDILAFGLKQNLELVYEPCEKGEYRIVAGERRWLALKMLVQKGYKEFEMATSKLTAPGDQEEEQVEIIIANAYRNKNVTDMIEEEKRLKEALEKMKAAGRSVKGYDLESGRLRDVIAAMLHISKTKVAQIESVNNNLIPEFKEELGNERITFSAAYELSGMQEAEQKEVFEKLKESGEGVSYKDLRLMKEKTEKEDNVKAGTCTKCDQYINKAEAEKTEEQHYSEEQDRIDRETARRLREHADEERMNNMPSTSEKDEKRVHEIRLGAMFFEDARSGKKSFELRKNDRDYKVGDILEMIEFKEGKNTGRVIRKSVTYILEDYTGLVDGYCIMSTSLIE